MNIYYLKMLIFNFLINTLILPHNVNYLNNHYNISLIPNNTQRTTIKSRLLAEIKNRNNPHYHNDPELKEIIDKLNEETIKKYQQTHDPYEQLQKLVEQKGTKTIGEHRVEPMSTIEKELLETYEEVFGDKNNVLLNSDMYPNDDGKSIENSSTCECTDINNTKLEKAKGKDKYLKHLKGRCTRGIYSCSVLSAFLTMLGLAAAKTATLGVIASYPSTIKTCVSSVLIFNLLERSTMLSALNAVTGCSAGAGDVVGTVSTTAMGAFYPYGIAALVLLILAVVLIFLFIWLYKKRKNSSKHECKKHLCK
ncbi:PIR protein, putative [Plasmodium sp.]|nr:PIR protein, putative [Plasmodium sp.]